MDRSSKTKINKETQALDDTLNKMDLIDFYRTFHPKTADYTFFSSAHGTSSRIDISWVTNQALVNLRKLKSYQVSFQPQLYETRYQLQEKICEKYKHMEAKQYATK